ncbi:zinc finger CCHC domain-containing protein 7-like isoform X2 [Alosa alosa]|uniref:zinc finger CCHC domain-containing protein 7-like isoform X2 n=1 Tax=Alosa alosa TaxID=278164 RepID=UPI0020154BD6|nr:zinc finger CCHC domain-containing protein 7-like isoform X2 [Alosa alosa]
MCFPWHRRAVRSMFARYVDCDESEGDEDRDDVEPELYSRLHYWSSGSVNSETEEEADHSASEHGDTAKYITISGECMASTSLDRSLRYLRNYSTSCGLQSVTGLSLEVSSDLEDNNIDVEDWMLVGGAEMEGDRNIQLNLEFGRKDSGSEEKWQKKEGDQNLWAISEKDKKTMTPSLRYFTPGLFLPNFLPRAGIVCSNCRKTGHMTRNCPASKRRVCCVLCGQQGHRQSLCPWRHCPVCGLPADTHLTGVQRPPHADLARPNRASRALPPCPLLSHCTQPCLRCGRSGHLQEACPDLWRQYHLTTEPGAPKKSGRNVRNPRPEGCYNCGRRGHSGHCFQKRMPGASSFSFLPHVSHYDTEEEIHKRQTATLSSIKGLLQTRARKGTWPERRRERRETKRLKRERARELSAGKRERSAGKRERSARKRARSTGKREASKHSSQKGGLCSPSHCPPKGAAGRTPYPHFAAEKRKRARERSAGKRGASKHSSQKGGLCSPSHCPPKGAAGGTPHPRSAAERRSGPRWMGRLSDRRRKSGGHGGRNLYPPDSSLVRGKAKRQRR